MYRTHRKIQNHGNVKCLIAIAKIEGFISLRHCVISAQIRSFSWSVFSRIRTEYGERYEVSLRIQSECWKIRTRKNSVFGHISQSRNLHFILTHLIPLFIFYIPLKTSKIPMYFVVFRRYRKRPIGMKPVKLMRSFKTLCISPLSFF